MAEQEVVGTSKLSFDEAARDAAKNADGKVQKGRGKVPVRLEVDVETQSPGIVHEYRVVLRF